MSLKIALHKSQNSPAQDTPLTARNPVFAVHTRPTGVPPVGRCLVLRQRAIVTSAAKARREVDGQPSVLTTSTPTRNSPSPASKAEWLSTHMNSLRTPSSKTPFPQPTNRQSKSPTNRQIANSYGRNAILNDLRLPRWSRAAELVPKYNRHAHSGVHLLGANVRPERLLREPSRRSPPAELQTQLDRRLQRSLVNARLPARNDLNIGAHVSSQYYTAFMRRFQPSLTHPASGSSYLAHIHASGTSSSLTSCSNKRNQLLFFDPM